jgi:prolyl 4-hydroxylase
MEIADGIWVTEDFFTADECVEWIDFAEDIGFTDKKIISGIRTSATIDDKDKSFLLWQRAKEHLPKMIYHHVAVGLNERLRFYRYNAEQKFAWHTDGTVTLPNNQKSLLTFLIYLNNNYQGGETAFRNELNTVVRPETGTMLAFKHEILHEGSEVKSGRKYILRSDVMFSA